MGRDRYNPLFGPTIQSFDLGKKRSTSYDNSGHQSNSEEAHQTRKQLFSPRAPNTIHRARDRRANFNNDRADGITYSDHEKRHRPRTSDWEARHDSRASSLDSLSPPAQEWLPAGMWQSDSNYNKSGVNDDGNEQDDEGGEQQETFFQSLSSTRVGSVGWFIVCILLVTVCVSLFASISGLTVCFPPLFGWAEKSAPSGGSRKGAFPSWYAASERKKSGSSWMRFSGKSASGDKDPYDWRKSPPWQSRKAPKCS